MTQDLSSAPVPESEVEINVEAEPNPAPDSEATGKGKVSGRWVRAWQAAWLPLLAAALVALVAVPYAGNFASSPFDEHTHFDYVAKIAVDGEIPPKSDVLGQVALGSYCGTGGAWGGLACEPLPLDATTAPFQGASAATNYPPPFYIATAMLARAIHAIDPDMTTALPSRDTSWLQASRYAMIAWLLMAVVLLVTIGRRLGASPLAVFGAAVLVGLTPIFLVQGTTVNNDVAAVAMGLLAVWAWLALEHRSPLLRITVAGALAIFAAVGFKLTALFAVLVVAVLEWRARVVVASASATELSSNESAEVGLREDQVSTTGETRSSTLLVIKAAIPTAVLLAVFAVSVRLEPLISAAVRGSTGGPSGGTIPSASLAKELASTVQYLFGSFTMSSANLFSGEFFARWPLYLGLAAIGGIFYAVLRSRVPWRADRDDVVRQALALFFIGFPLVMLLYIALQGGTPFFQSRYLMGGAALAVVFLVVGIRKWWAATVLVVGSLFWVVVVVKVYTTTWGWALPEAFLKL